MAQNTYETLLILDSNHYARDPGGVAQKISDIITEAGGKVVVSRLWMEQKLAYPIDKHQKGTYWLAYSEMDGVHLPKIDRALKLYESVIRHMTIRLEPRLVEPILANARGESVRVSTPSDSESEGESSSADAEDAEKVAVEA